MTELTMEGHRRKDPSPNKSNAGTAASVSSTPASKSSSSIVTPATNKTSKSGKQSSCTHHVPIRSTRSNKRKSEKLTPNPRLFSSRQKYVTCLHFGLDHNNDEHKPVICSTCLKVCMGAKDGIVTKDIIERKRGQGRQCLRPWYIDNKKHREERTRVNYFNFMNLFDIDESELSDVATEEGEGDVGTCDGDGGDNDAPQRKKRMKTKHSSQQPTKEDTPTPPNISLNVFDMDAHFTDGMVHLVETQLKANIQGNRAPSNNDKKIAGMLMKYLFQFENKNQNKSNVLTLPSFAGERPVVAAKVPMTYLTSGDSTRHHNRQLERINNWIELLKYGNFDIDSLINEIILKKGEIPVKYLIETLTDQHRLSLEDTLTICEYANITPSQLRRLAQALDVATRVDGMTSGLRIFAPTNDLYTAKRAHVEKECATLKFTMVNLEDDVLVSKKSQSRSVAKLKPTSVSSSDPKANILTRIRGLRQGNRFICTDHRCKVPFKVPDGCITAGMKYSADKGGNSFKMCDSPLNVVNPQGRENMNIFLEYAGKDSYNNVKKVLDALPEVKSGIEDVIWRKVVVIEIRIGGIRGYVVATNTDSSHKFEAPSALPFLSNERVECTYGPQPVLSAIIDINFSHVTSTKLICNAEGTFFHGLQFEGVGESVVGKAMFGSGISSKEKDPKIEMQQITMFGVFTTDLELTSKNYAHQGASAKYGCPFCYATLTDMARVVTRDQCEIAPRTLEEIEADCAKFKSKCDSAKEQEKNKHNFRKEITQKETHSIAENEPLLRVPMCCATKASMHVILGMTTYLIELSISGYECIEIKSAEIADGNNGAYAKKTIELALSKMKRYVDFLTEQISDTRNMEKLMSNDDEDIATALHTRVDSLRRHIREIERELEESFEVSTEEMTNKQVELEAEVELIEKQLSHHLFGTNDEDISDYMLLLLEQLCITNNTIEECEAFLKNHTGYARHVYESSLKNNGVDRQVYFAGTVVGNQCMTMAKNFEAIYDSCADAMALVVAPELKNELENFTSSMKEIISLWYKIQRVIKSADKQSDAIIDEFKSNVNELRSLVLKLCDDSTTPIDSWQAKLPSLLKGHILFFSHLLEQLEEWGTLGGFDEQSIESCHAEWNLMLRQFGATRGKELQKKVMGGFLFKSAEFVRTTIAEIKQITSRGRNKKKSTPRISRSSTETIANNAVAQNFRTINECDDVKQINQEVALHQHLHLSDDSNITVLPEETMVKTCPHCNKKLLAVAYPIHLYETHNICVEIES